ncbi:hypothetical protein [Novosphingobium meiothermophilum]|uniref:hypothetical protein n=1 Tax=Novosphingobium meiothermophilum TaxID=2202251 RepID=UPI000D6E489D|nr:hypothetical protein [Novosphingobium meiothermophilum]
MAKVVSLEHLPDDTVRGLVEHIATNLRQADIDEIQASVGGEPAEAVRQSVACSTRCWVGLDRTGLPVVLFGVAPSVIAGVGQPWLVATDASGRERVAFARLSRPYAEEMLEVYPVLTNFVDVRNEAALDWLVWAGFRFIDADPRHGPEKRPFIQFSRSR